MAAFDTWAKRRAATGFRIGRTLPHAGGAASLTSIEQQMIMRWHGQQDLQAFEPPDPPESGSSSILQIGLGVGCGLL